LTQFRNLRDDGAVPTPGWGRLDKRLGRPKNGLMKRSWKTVAPWAAICLLVTVVAAGPSQQLEVVVERTELKWSSTGRVLGHLNRGAPLERLDGRGGWTRVGVHGWMWRPSLARSGDRYRVTPGRENLRVGPNGKILGSLVHGVEVRRVGTQGQWFEIEMIGWLRNSAVREVTVAEPAGAEGATGDESVPATGTTTPSTRRGTIGQLAESVGMRAKPGGSEIATLPKGLNLAALETRGDWTRVRVEGWVPAGVVETGSGAGATPAAVALAPEEFTGHQVAWTLEHIALQTADEWRTDFERGELYDLARSPSNDRQYVYIVVPPALKDEFEQLAPFQTIRVEGTVRTGRSTLTGNPIVVAERIVP